MTTADAMATDRNVYIVDDDAVFRRSLSKLLRIASFEPTGYATPLEFLENCTELPTGCVLLDLRMPVMDGLATQAELKRRGVWLPIVMVSAQRDVAAAVEAMKGGAVDFIEKPFEESRLIAAIVTALDVFHTTCDMAIAAAKISSLTHRECQVLDGLVAGHSNKVIAHDLQISVRTVEVHRANMLGRLGVHGLGEAVRLAVMAGFAHRSGCASVSRRPDNRSLSQN